MKADPWVLNILDQGLIIPFTGDPPKYYEKNNKSALIHMVELRKIIKDWELQDICQKVSFQPKCVNPLTMVVQTNQVTQEKKYRSVIDMSRHLNNFMIVPHTKLQDLNVSEPWLERDMYQTSLDLKSMFHHVKLNPCMYTYFGFA